MISTRFMRPFAFAGLGVTAAAAVVAACAAPAPPPAQGVASAPSAPPLPVVDAAPGVDAGPPLVGPDTALLDRAAAPCDDFYEFACGTWMKSTPIPDDEASWVRSFSVIHEDDQKALQAILERDSRGDTRGDAYGKELGDLWSSCMDEAAIEAVGTTELKAELAEVDAVRDARGLIQEIARLHLIGVNAAFDFDSEVDFKDATHMIAGLSQSGLGLPERDYYFRDDARTKAIREQYLTHVASVLELAGETKTAAAAHAKTVMKLETELAHASMTNVELRDPQKVYHRIDLDGLRKLAPDVAWAEYLAGIGFPAITAINVGQPDFVKEIDAMTKTVPMRDWQVYLRYHLTSSVSPWLSKPFVDESFHFRQVLTGTKVLQPRWKRCVRAADQAMGEALAQPFVQETLGDDGKRAAQRMVSGIEASMKSDIESVAWMDDATRAKAEDKLARVTNKIGFPSKWRSYEGLAITKSSYLKNMERATAFEAKRRLTKVGQPVDKEEWDMTPPTVNAYYDPTMNQMVFPAGILQVPFYGREQAPALNFGAIGMVVGHELTHGFDDQGRQFDAEGNLRDWWSPAVSSEFDKRAACVASQYDGYVAIDDQHVKGKLTLGENIADLGGVKLSYAAFKRDEREDPAAAASASGFTADQAFFVGFAQAWCANYRPEAQRLLVATNPHSPPKFRVNGPLSNLSEFAAAFQCKEGAPMVRAKEQRCEVW
jgi:putative endopeptidase